MIHEQTPSPTEIRLNPAKNELTVTFDDDSRFIFSAEFLRVHSPSAEVKGHGADERKIIGGKRGVTILSIEPTGHYAIRILFSDGHNTGLYSWPYLRETGRDQEKLWNQYLQDLEKRGLTRG